MRELTLLHQIFRSNTQLPPHVTIPPGDDMGAIALDDAQVLVTVDQLIDGIHFDWDRLCGKTHGRTGVSPVVGRDGRSANAIGCFPKEPNTPIEKIGRKAITRNLSDVAAMGALPVGAVVAANLPRDLSQEQTDKLIAAMQQTGLRYDCPLFGGDVAITDQKLALTVTVLAQQAGVDCIKRSGAQVGDIICVTGQLGGSLHMDIKGNAHHLDFEPRLKAGRLLASSQCARPTAMIDLSDGLAVDLAHICRASGVGAQIDIQTLPIRQTVFQNEGSENKRDASHADLANHPVDENLKPWQHALGDGEDYELCFTVHPDQANHWLEQGVDQVPITAVGKIIAINQPSPQDDALLSLQNPVRLLLPNGQVQTAAGLGWEHQSE